MLYGLTNPHGGDIYGGGVTLDFSANTNPFGTPPGVIRAIAEALPQMHRYPTVALWWTPSRILRALTGSTFSAATARRS